MKTKEAIQTMVDNEINKVTEIEPPVETKSSIKLNMLLNAVKGLMSILFPLITFPYISRILGVNNLGKYNFANSIINYYVLLAGLGIATYAIREGSRIRTKKDEFNAFADQMFSINIISTILAYLFLIALIVIIQKFKDYQLLLTILSLQIIFKTIGIEWVYSIYEEYAYITIRSIIFQFVSIILMFILIKNDTDLNIYAVITVIAGAGSNIINYFYAKKYCKVKFTKNIDWNKHLKPIMTLFAMTVTTTVYVSSDTTILGFLCTDYEVGIYSVSVKIYTIVKTILSSVLIVSIPRLSAMLGNNDYIGFRSVAEEIYKILITVLLPFVIGIIMLRNEVILIISSKEYVEAVTSMVFLSIALLFSLGAWFWGQCILIPIKKENVVFKVTVLSAMLNLVLNFFLIPTWKENGAAFTTILAEGMAFFLCLIEGKKSINLFGVNKIILKALIGCAGIIVVAILLRIPQLGMLNYTILTIIFSAIVYFIIEILIKNEVLIELLVSVLKK